MGVYKEIAFWLVIVGGINWGLGLFDVNLVSLLAEQTGAWLSTVVYSLVGVSAIYLAYDKLQG